MKRVYKYPFPMQDRFTISLPWNADILCAQVQKGIPKIWALVNPKNSLQERHFRLAGTGHPIKLSSNLKYINTLQLNEGTLVLHLFEMLNE